jgi:RNA polymerase sigma-70 factor (ECF subfamily)
VALQTLELRVLPVVARMLARQRVPHDRRADAMQSLRERMLVATGGVRGITAYDGRAPLAMWLGIGAFRIGRRQTESDRRSVVLEDHQLDQVAPGVPDPALLYLKRHYGAQFRAAFAAAVDSLPPRQRNLLRHAVLDELGIDQIAAIYHVHRATAARQLNQARAALVEATRQRMRAALRISEAELESILRGVISLTDLTLRALLARGRGHR